VNIERNGGEKGATGGPTMARGTSQNGVRLYNERLVLSLIRRYEAVPKAELARLTHLSAQTVSVIVRQLEKDNLVIKGKPQRGKVGQPLTPFTLNPDGAFSIGLKVGRRSGDLLLLDLTGKVRSKVYKPYRFPAPQELLSFVSTSLEELLAGLSPVQRERVSGLGIAAPFELWNWEEAIGAPRDVMEAWRGFDLAAELAKLGHWPVHYCNDATAACAAELLFGKGKQHRNYAYLYVGYFVGGGVVINGHIFQGPTGYAGAMGPLPIYVQGQKPQQLLHHASLYVLENQLQAAGLDPMLLANSPDDWTGIETQLDAWLNQTATSLAYACAASMSVIDFEAIIIDGAMPTYVRADLVARTRLALKALDIRGLPPFTIEEGSIGIDARALGAASLPLFANFIIDRDVLFKEAI
jgi:predicted NBD/HSP70 family sugar kinase